MGAADMDAAVATIRGGLGRLRDQLCATSAEETLRALQGVLDEAASLRSAAIRLMDARRREASTARQRDTAAQLAEDLEIERSEARRMVSRARAVEALPSLADALDAGQISPAAADAITRARRQPSDITALQNAQDDLVELARTAHPDEVAKRARWVVAANREQLRRRRAHQEADRGLRLHTRADGLVGIQGALLPEVGEAWRTVLDSLVKATYRGDDPGDAGRVGDAPHGTHAHADGGEGGTRTADGQDAAGADLGGDSRSGAQRMHDVFAGLGRRVLAEGLTPQVHGAAPTTLVCIDLRSFDPSCHTPGLLDALGLDPDAMRAAVGSLLPHQAGLLPETGALLPAEIVRRIADDGGKIIPLLFDGYTPLARGRTLRTADHDLRLGLIARDQGCVDCGAPPSWCDADHDPPWDDGGRTDPDQLELRCRPEHVERHRQLGLDPPPAASRTQPGGPVARESPGVYRLELARPVGSAARSDASSGAQAGATSWPAASRSSIVSQRANRRRRASSVATSSVSVLRRPSGAVERPCMLNCGPHSPGWGCGRPSTGPCRVAPANAAATSGSWSASKVSRCVAPSTLRSSVLSTAETGWHSTCRRASSTSPRGSRSAAGSTVTPSTR